MMDKSTCIFHAKNKTKPPIRDRRQNLSALSANVQICILTKLRELYILPVLELVLFCNYFKKCCIFLRFYVGFSFLVFEFFLLCFYCKFCFCQVCFCCFIFFFLLGGLPLQTVSKKCKFIRVLYGRPLSMFIFDMYLYLTVPTISPP